MAISTAGKWGLAYVVGFFLLVVTVVTAPFMIANNLQAQAEAKGDEISMLTQRLAKLAKAAAGSQGKVEAASILIHGQTEGIASAEMQRIVAAMADRAGLRISRIQPVNVSQDGSAVSLQLELEAQGSVESLQNFLYALESGKPFAFVREVNIAVDESGQPSVRMTLETTGWVGNI